jgi:hypothetical protein
LSSSLTNGQVNIARSSFLEDESVADEIDEVAANRLAEDTKAYEAASPELRAEYAALCEADKEDAERFSTFLFRQWRRTGEYRATMDAALERMRREPKWRAEYEASCGPDPVGFALWLSDREFSAVTEMLIKLGVPGDHNGGDAIQLALLSPETRARLLFDGKSLP